jgi:hypothetical protein
VTFGLVLVIVGGFLLGGAWSVWRGEPGGTARRGPARVVLALVVLAAALLATVAGILRLV